MKFITPIILVILAIGIFFGYTDGVYQDVKGLSITKAQLADAQANAAKLRAKRDLLVQDYNNIPDASIQRLQKALPDGVNNVGLVLDINDIASKYGMIIKGIQINQETAGSGAVVLGPDSKPYGSITLSFSVTTSYETFQLFLHDLESSLRVVDLTSLSFASNKDNLYTYSLTIQTYWLK
ncbi:MAG: type 4a pilus biogenesis protein PilO [Candidatus Pacebacteria bacterium]|nr:type 4a pilus biogenesis protein PilO [Candidatus Paceibacterota bacterium]